MKERDGVRACVRMTMKGKEGERLFPREMRSGGRILLGVLVVGQFMLFSCCDGVWDSDDSRTILRRWVMLGHAIKILHCWMRGFRFE